MWFEVATVSTLFAVGQILFGRFEEGTPRWRRLAKLGVVMGLALLASRFLGPAGFWVWLGLMLLPAVYVHVWWLPRHGVNGWTAEPRERYYALRGWRLPESRDDRPPGAEGRPG